MFFTKTKIYTSQYKYPNKNTEIITTNIDGYYVKLIRLLLKKIYASLHSLVYRLLYLKYADLVAHCFLERCQKQ